MKKFLHPERCAGVNCIMKDNCKIHKIPFELAKETIRNFLVRKSDHYHCDKYEPVNEDIEKLN